MSTKYRAKYSRKGKYNGFHHDKLLRTLSRCGPLVSVCCLFGIDGTIFDNEFLKISELVIQSKLIRSILCEK